MISIILTSCQKDDFTINDDLQNIEIDSSKVIKVSDLVGKIYKPTKIDTSKRKKRLKRFLRKSKKSNQVKRSQ
jgi:uncharacterized protein YaiI (UPF0178 family)